MRIERLLLPEGFLARWVAIAVEFGLVHLLMALKSTVRGETLAAALPSAREIATGVSMSIFDVSLQVVFSRKGLVTSFVRADKRTFLVVRSHMGLKTTGTVEALAAPLEFTDITPCSLGLALGSFLAVVEVIHDSVFGALWRRIDLGIGRIVGGVFGGRFNRWRGSDLAHLLGGTVHGAHGFAFGSHGNGLMTMRVEVACCMRTFKKIVGAKPKVRQEHF